MKEISSLQPLQIFSLYVKTCTSKLTHKLHSLYLTSSNNSKTDKPNTLYTASFFKMATISLGFGEDLFFSITLTIIGIKVSLYWLKNAVNNPSMQG